MHASFLTSIAIFIVIVIFVMCCTWQVPDITPLIPLVPPLTPIINPLIPLTPPLAPIDQKNIVAKGTLGIATNGCQNVFFFGFLNKKPSKITGLMKLNNGPSIVLKVDPGTLRPYSYNDKYSYGFTALWPTPIKDGDTLYVETTIYSETSKQNVSHSMKIPKCPQSPVIIWQE